MKKIISVFLSLVIVLSASGTAYCSASVTITATPTDSESTLVLNGVSTDIREKQVYILVAKSDASVMSSAEINAIRQIFTNAAIKSDGSYYKKIILPSAFPGGKYKATVYADGVSGSTTFTYVNPNVYEQIANQITSNMSAADITAIMDVRYTELLIDTDFYNSSKSLVCAILSKQSAGGYTASSLEKTMKSAFAAYELRNYADIESVFLAYLPYMNYAADFSALSAGVKAAMPDYLASADYLSGTFEQVYNTGVKILTIKTAGDYTAIQDYIEDNSSSLGISLAEYNKRSEYNRDLIMKDMYSRKGEISKLDDIEDLFSEICSGYPEQSSQGGGGGGGGGGISAPPPSAEQGPSNPTTGQEVDFNPSSGTGSPNGFTDMNGHWSNSVVSLLANHGIISGYADGSFKPENKVTRAEYFKMISYFISKYSASSDPVFADVSPDDWFYPYISRLFDAKIVTGYDGRINPDNEITREEAAAIIFRLLKYKGFDFVSSYVFDDMNTVSPWASEAVGSLGAIGVINGYNNAFSPLNNLTRAEAASMIANLIQKSLVEVIQ